MNDADYFTFDKRFEEWDYGNANNSDSWWSGWFWYETRYN